MNLFSLSGLLIGITCLLLIVILLKYGKSKLHRAWVFFNVSVAIWGFGSFFIGLTHDNNLALLLWKLAHIGVIFISISFYHVVCIFCDKKQKTFLYFAYILGFIFLFLNLFTNIFIPKLEFLFSSFYYAKSEGMVYPLFFIFWISLVTLGNIQLLKYYKDSSAIRKNQILYFFYGVFTGFLGGAMNFFPILGWDIYPYGNFAIPIYCIIVTYAIIRYRLMDITAVITRTGVFVATYSLVLGIPLILANVFRKYLVGLLGDNWWYVPMGLLIVFATVGPFIYIYLNKKAEDRLLREQKRYQHTLRQASAGMTRIRDLKRLLNLIVHVVTKAVKIEFASIFLLDFENNNYRLLAIRDSANVHLSLSLEKDSSIVERLYTKREPIVYEETQLQAQDTPNDLKLNTLEKQLKEINAAVVVPSFVSNKLLGFIVLGRKLSGKTYSQDDLNVLMVLANQMALAIENASSYQELKNTRDQIMQLEKLAITGKLARMIAHEIKNPLTAIKTFTEYLDDKYESKEFRKKFKYIINSEMDRLNNIASKLSDAGKINTPRFKNNIDMHQIIEAISLLLEKESHNQKIKLICELKAKKFSLKVDPDQLKQCFLNLIINSMQALQEKPNLEKQITVITDNLESDTEKLIIEIVDNGPGIPEAELSRIFEPFFTTKEKGTGLGLAVVQGIILAHNGKITCQSQVNQGTTFRIELPL